MNPPPPMPHDEAFRTQTAYAVAIAASTALPPRRRMSPPISAARGCSAATAPWCSVHPTGDACAAGARRFRAAGCCSCRTNGDSPETVGARRSATTAAGASARATFTVANAPPQSTTTSATPTVARVIPTSPSARTRPS